MGTADALGDRVADINDDEAVFTRRGSRRQALLSGRLRYGVGDLR